MAAGIPGYRNETTPTKLKSLLPGYGSIHVAWKIECGYHVGKVEGAVAICRAAYAIAATARMRSSPVAESLPKPVAPFVAPNPATLTPSSAPYPRQLHCISHRSVDMKPLLLPAANLP